MTDKWDMILNSPEYNDDIKEMVYTIDHLVNFAERVKRFGDMTPHKAIQLLGYLSLIRRTMIDTYGFYDWEWLLDDVEELLGLGLKGFLKDPEGVLSAILNALSGLAINPVS